MDKETYVLLGGAAIVGLWLLLHWVKGRNTDQCTDCDGTGIAEGGYECTPCRGSGKKS